MTPLLAGLVVVGVCALVCGVVLVCRRRARRRVQTLIWDPASGRWTEVRGRAAVRSGRV